MLYPLSGMGGGGIILAAKLLLRKTNSIFGRSLIRFVVKTNAGGDKNTVKKLINYQQFKDLYSSILVCLNCYLK